MESGVFTAMSPEEIKLGYQLLLFLRKATSHEHVYKFNVIGSGVHGAFERETQRDFTPAEKQSLIWFWDELKRLRLIVPTGTDLSRPDDWVVVTPEGMKITEADFAALFDTERKPDAKADDSLDAVTGLLSRGALDAALSGLAGETDVSSPASLVMADIDHFKTFNDNYGHETGDATLRAVADASSKVVRGKGKAYRYGGEEITVLLWNHSLLEAAAVAERMRIAVENTQVPNLNDCPVTASFGVATFPETSQIETLITDADRAMYEAKETGRNRVCCAKAEASGQPVRPKQVTAIPHQLEQMAERRTEVLIRPVIPAACQSYRFIVEAVTATSVQLKMRSGHESFELPPSRIAEILSHETNEPPTLVLNGRLQWLTMPEKWKFFPEPLASDEHRLWGFGKPSSIQDRRVKEITNAMKYRGFGMAWCAESNLGSRLGITLEIVYDDDGYFFKMSTVPEPQILTKKVLAGS